FYLNQKPSVDFREIENLLDGESSLQRMADEEDAFSVGHAQLAAGDVAREEVAVAIDFRADAPGFAVAAQAAGFCWSSPFSPDVTNARKCPGQVSNRLGATCRTNASVRAKISAPDSQFNANSASSCAAESFSRRIKNLICGTMPGVALSSSTPSPS